MGIDGLLSRKKKAWLPWTTFPVFNSIKNRSSFYDRLPTSHKRTALSRSHRNQAHIIEDIFEALCASVFHEVRWKEAVFKTEERSRDSGEKDLYSKQCYICGIRGYHKFWNNKIKKLEQQQRGRTG